MTERLFVGGPWHGRTHDVPDDYLDWRVPVTSDTRLTQDYQVYVRRSIGGVIDGRRYVRYVFVHIKLIADTERVDRALAAILISLWVKDAPDVTE